MENEKLLETIWAKYNRSQRTSRWISLTVTAVTIVVGASLVFIATAATAGYYSARKEIDELESQINDINRQTPEPKEKMNEGPTPKPKKSETPVAVNPVPTPTPCANETPAEQSVKDPDQTGDLKTIITDLRNKLDECEKGRSARPGRGMRGANVPVANR